MEHPVNQEQSLGFSFLNVVIITLALLLTSGKGLAAEVVTINNLIWQQADPGVSGNWESANSYCTDLSLAGYTDWRLPTEDELKSIVYCSNGKATPLPNWDVNQTDAFNGINSTCYKSQGVMDFVQPTIDPRLDHPSHAAGVWTSTSAGTGLAWNVHFTQGNCYPNDKESYISGLVRCVHDVKPVPPPTCTSSNLTACTSVTSCQAAGGEWKNGRCTSRSVGTHLPAILILLKGL